MRMIWSNSGWYALACVAVASLAGCGDTTVQEQLGLRRDAPDEFQVVRRAPLAIPNSLTDLPPPRPGAPPIGRANSSEEARRVLLGSAGAAPAVAAATADQPVSEPTPGQVALLTDAGGTPADPDIRQELANDQQDSQSISTRTFLYIAFWQKPKPEDQPGVVLDPATEAKRLQEAGIPVSARPLTVRVGSVPLATPPVR